MYKYIHSQEFGQRSRDAEKCCRDDAHVAAGLVRRMCVIYTCICAFFAGSARLLSRNDLHRARGRLINRPFNCMEEMRMYMCMYMYICAVAVRSRTTRIFRGFATIIPVRLYYRYKFVCKGW